MSIVAPCTGCTLVRSGFGRAVDYRIISDRQRWHTTLLALPANHVLQSWDWGQVKEHHGWVPHRLCWERDGKTVAAAQMLRRPLPHTPWGVMYVPKGPALDYSQSGLLDRVLADLEGFARRQRAVLIKIDPDVDLPGVSLALSGRGWRYSSEQVQFRNTALLDLTPTEDDLLAAMKSKTRYNIRLAQRRGVVVRTGSMADIPRFYAMYAETGRRDGFLIRPFDYYHDTWKSFLDRGLAHMLLAEVDGEAVAGLILFRFGAKTWYMYGASMGKHRNRMPNHLLQWEAIRWSKSQGCRVYDLWGAPDHLEESDPLWNVWRFKVGFGAQFAPHIGAFDYPVSRVLYWAYSVALPRYLGWLRLRHQPDQ